MPSIRKTKTATGATAIQVVRYEERKVVVMKHIGSAHTVDGVRDLIAMAEAWIDEHVGQRFLLPQPSSDVIHLSTARLVGVRYSFAYHFLTTCIQFTHNCHPEASRLKDL